MSAIYAALICSWLSSSNELNCQSSFIKVSVPVIQMTPCSEPFASVSDDELHTVRTMSEQFTASVTY